MVIQVLADDFALKCVVNICRYYIKNDPSCMKKLKRDDIDRRSPRSLIRMNTICIHLSMQQVDRVIVLARHTNHVYLMVKVVQFIQFLWMWIKLNSMIVYDVCTYMLTEKSPCNLYLHGVPNISVVFESRTFVQLTTFSMLSLLDFISLPTPILKLKKYSTYEQYLCIELLHAPMGWCLVDPFCHCECPGRSPSLLGKIAGMCLPSAITD